MQYNHTQIRQARQTELKPILEKLGYQLQPQPDDNYKIINLKKQITIKQGYWICHDDNTHGNAIDFMTKIEHKSFAQAMKILFGSK
jgi:hypothetical protein